MDRILSILQVQPLFALATYDHALSINMHYLVAESHNIIRELWLVSFL